MYHNPVLLNECIDGLAIQPGGTYADLTFGGGGHSRAILSRLGENGRLIAFDADSDASRNLPEDNRIVFVNHNFRFLKNFLRYYNAIPINGILVDLGVSSHQFDTAEKGFSIRFDAPLDLRLNQSQKLNAAEVVNTYPEDKLSKVFYNYGELSNARRISRTICKARQLKTIANTFELIELMQSFAPPQMQQKFLAQVFQALRIEVNDELGALTDMLGQVLDVLGQDGRLVILSYHSLEDRIVKNFMRTGNVQGELQKDFYGNVNSGFEVLTKKPVIPKDSEINFNKRARSAKLRIAKKTGQ